MAKSIDIDGGWEVVRIYLKRGDNESYLEVFPPGSHRWELRGGLLTETIAGKGVFQTGYTYSPKDKVLRIDRRAFEPDGLLWLREEDAYGIVPAAEDELILMEFEEEVGNGFLFRQLLLRRIP